MKKEVMILFLLGIILILPIISAQEQVQTYSGFDRFIDNAKLFFSFGDNKVKLALEIREKEVNSAIGNFQNENEKDADKNLEKAWEKLQVIQEKVSLNTAEEVKQNSEQLRENIRTQENLPDDFEVYVLEEEKTGLTAEWVIEKEGKEGQNLSWEVVGNATGEQGRTIEIEKRIDEIDTEISEWVVEHTYAEGTGPGGEAGVVVEGGLATVVKNEVVKGDNGLKPEVKTSVAKDGGKNDGVDPGPQGIVGTIDSSDSDGSEDSEGETNEVVEGDGGEGDYAEGTTADGIDAGSDGSSDSSGEGTNDVAPEES